MEGRRRGGFSTGKHWLLTGQPYFHKWENSRCAINACVHKLFPFVLWGLLKFYQLASFTDRCVPKVFKEKEASGFDFSLREVAEATEYDQWGRQGMLATAQ